MITLRSSNDEVFEVEVIAMESHTIKYMIKDDWANNGIPLPNLSSRILVKVVEYCKEYINVATSKSSSEDTTKSKISDEDLNAPYEVSPGPCRATVCQPMCQAQANQPN
ncbi:hypothetical protein ZIOFF_002006 [Zingiber officinale]|uniref:SKP1 component POZ domain-containing protein n=1 Tax=Zingiber officinale TaxID=94328 RepID=A0A8J5LVI0_ZINOF|nr:hypothetical protein ZIOFF_002006 [Zingiber officinale]